MSRPRSHSLPPTNRSKVAREQDGIAKNQSQIRDTGIYDQRTYPNAYEDPDPVPSEIPKEEFERHKKIVIKFGDEMYDAFSGVDSVGEELRVDLVSTFRPHTIDEWPNGLTSE